ncbi:MAG TPA: sigma-70 family RNA polymerase sigma factor [Gemmatimonadaceae bacterium]
MTGDSLAPPRSAANTTDSVVDDAVRRAQAGDVDAFGIVYRVHAPAIHALCRRMLGNEEDAREMVQDVFVRAWEKLASFRGESALRTWLHRLGVNLMLERLRATRRDALRFADDPGDVSAGGPALDRRLDTQMDVAAALDRLPNGSRMVLVLHDIEGYSHEEIAAMTGIAPGTSRAQLWRARRHLSRMLDA